MERAVSACTQQLAAGTPAAELRPPGTLQQLGNPGQLIEVVVSGAQGAHMCVELCWASWANGAGRWTCGASMTVLPVRASVALWDAAP